MNRVLLKIFLVTVALAHAATAGAEANNAIHAHSFQAGEHFRYDYDNTDIIFCADLMSGLPIAGDPSSIQQIRIHTQTEIISFQGRLSHKITLLPDSELRGSDAANFNQAKFTPLNRLITNYPSELSYSYPDEGYALSHLYDLFKGALRNPNFMTDPNAQVLFFKTQDVHQMQNSALEVHDGLLPGDSYITPAHATPGLGGKFLGGPAQYLYVDVERINGARVAQVRVTNLGNQFTTDNLSTYTNFTFTMYIALEGPNKGLLINGTGQETAYPTPETPDARCPHPVLQRQFSIHLN